MKIAQGDIYLANLNPTKGHEKAGMRPVLIMQNDILNKNLNTVIIAPLTSNLTAKGFLTTWFLSKKTSNLKNDSIILLFQIRTIDKLRLEKKVSTLSRIEFSKIKNQMKFVF
ncbi:MAG: type II toxin-antitoxin system PemK/MazF family toxin [Candidatus Gracilibacteria bacterium]|nr:type II toxin-antitoxin system PemK/MazF family toxin [Candidatus Gracilibacteria bacterium]